MSKMDPDEISSANAWSNGQQPFIDFSRQQQNQGGAAFLNCGAGIESQLSELSRSADILSSIAGEPNGQTKVEEIFKSYGGGREWDPNGMLNNLSFLEQKIHQLQEMVHLIIARRSQAVSHPNEILFQQQQLITADLTSIIVQLISTAGNLLPSVKHSLPAVTPQLSKSIVPPVANVEKVAVAVADQSHEMDFAMNNTPVQNSAVNEHEGKDDEDGDEGESLPPGSYEILQLEKEEILAPHTHFCPICGKGFKRDANLRMHMRGHGDEYKTTAALAKPSKDLSTEPTLIKRYSCPFLGCKRNKDHKKFQPLKTILCVKNHYKRTHCDKSFICSRCHVKRFSVIADLKTHEKHCGKDRWLCSCGTTFSRKDKLFGHISLFQGHFPAIPLDDHPKGSAGPSQSSVSGRDGFQIPTSSPPSCLSPLSFGGCPDFPRSQFEDSDCNFSFPDSFI